MNMSAATKESTKRVRTFGQSHIPDQRFSRRRFALMPISTLIMMRLGGILPNETQFQILWRPRARTKMCTMGLLNKLQMQS